MNKIAVIGAGIFGITIALKLSEKFEVSLFEKSEDILSGASSNNHLRHHYGYHYPRSKETALESIKGKKSFKDFYGECIIEGFPAYYAVAKENSKTNSKEFLNFCKDLDLEYEIVDPDPEIFNTSKIDICLKTPEPCYDPFVLKNIVKNKLKNSRIKMRFKQEIIGGRIIKNKKKSLKIKYNNEILEEEFDVIISAIYTQFNDINQWFEFPKKKVHYALIELIDIQLPKPVRFGAMIIDGDFSTFVPSGKPGIVRLGHVKASVLKETISDYLPDEFLSIKKESNKDKIIEESAVYYPIVKKAKFLKSIFINRIVKANVNNTDERLTEITDHGENIYSIFGGKVITCVETANNLFDTLSKFS